MNDAELTLVLKAKNLASRPVDQLHSSLGRVKGSAGRAGSALMLLGKVAAIGLAAIAVGALAVAPEILSMAVKLESMGKKAKIVFGDQIGLVTKWAEKNAAAMGLTSATAVGLAANFGDLLVPMGFTRQAAAEMSTQVVGLSGALAEWSGGTRTAAEVSQILAKAMLGERESLKELGISITDADVKARLLKNGTDKLTGAQLEQAKATATQELIFEKSADAQAAYAKGGDSLARKQALLKAKFDQVVETLVTAVTPALTALMTFVMDKAIPAVGDLWDSLKPVRDVLGAIFGFIGDVLGVLDKFGKWITSNKKLMSGFAAGFDGIRRAIGNVVDTVKQLVAWVQTAIEWLGKLDIVKDRTNLGGNLTAPAGHAAGGWVGLNGPEIGIVGERGPEYIVPNHKLGGMGGGGVPVVIPVILDGKEIGRVVDQRLYYAIQKAAPTLGRS